LDQLKTAIREKGIAVEELRQYSYDTNRNQTDIKNTKTGEDQTYVYDAENRLSQVSVTKDGKTAVIQQNIYNGEGQRIQKIDGETMIQGYDQAKNEVCYTGGIYDQSTGLYYLNARYYDPEDGRFLTEDTYHGENDKPDTQYLYVYCANNPVNYVDPSGHYAVALYTLVKIVAGGVVFYVSYSTWKRRRIKTRYATRILNEKYGKGNWGKGPGSEYSRIIKYHRK
jgi:RHS repeat-associated protein